MLLLRVDQSFSFYSLDAGEPCAQHFLHFFLQFLTVLDINVLRGGQNIGVQPAM